MPPPASPALLESALYELVTALLAPAGTDADLLQLVPACAVCRLTARSVERWLRTYLAEYVNDPASRDVLRRAQGFCGEHTRVLASLNETLGIAILYADLARLTRERWEQSLAGSAPLSFWRKNNPLRRQSEERPAPCPACAAQQEAQARFVRACAEGLDKPDVWNALQANAGLCAPHISQIAGYAAPEAAARLLRLESERLTALQAELEEIIRKNDYRFRGEAWGGERNAWRRALDKLRKS